MPTSLGLYEELDATDREPVAITGDGGLVLCNPSPHGGMWAFRLLNAAGQPIVQAADVVLPREVRPLTTVSNNLTEVVALLAGLEYFRDGAPVLVRSDSLNAIRVFREPHKPRDWLPAEILARVRAVAARLGALTFELLAGHPKAAQLVLLNAGLPCKNGKGYPYCLHNHWCDQAATAAWAAYKLERGEL